MATGSLLLGMFLGLGSCSGGGGETGAAGTGGSFVILGTEPENNGEIFLNNGLTIHFSREFDLSTVNFNSVNFTVRDLSGNPVSEQVVGNFSYGKKGAVVDRTVLKFDPKLPSNDSYSNGGFRPARQYIVSFAQTTSGTTPTIRDLEGRGISNDSKIKALSFRTRTGSTPPELFDDSLPYGPAVLRTDITPTVNGRVLLNELSGVPVEVELSFDQALNPASSNVPVQQNPDPTTWNTREKGSVFLEYDDPVLGKNLWIRAQVALPKNDNSGAVMVLRPEGILPNNATVRVIVEADLQDLAGQNNRSTIGYRRVVATFQTEEGFAPRFDAISVQFATTDLLDPEAPLRDPVAALKDGVLSATFAFEGQDTPFDYRPSAVTNVLNTIRQQVQPVQGRPFTVIGGVFPFHDITIPEGVTVQGFGSNPLVFLATGTVRIDGHLSVDGGDGDQVNTLNSANFPTAGGQGACGGGLGGKGSQNTSGTTQRGESGYGPGNRRNGGGEGGGVGCSNATGSGGGGGSHRIKGDDDYYGQTNAMVRGDGGGAKGGKAGPTVVTNSRSDDDFFGTLVNNKGELVVGELSAPIGGAGGGGGGDRTAAKENNGSCFQAGQGFLNDQKGGGGGGGAGVLIVKALGPIIIGDKGLVSADGGKGGGGQDAGSCRHGGGGGSGSGGMVLLMSASRIEFETHGGRWASAGSWDSSFAISADGDIGTNSGFISPLRDRKYSGASQWNAGVANRGGFGGMGIVQLMVPPASDADGTNDPQDDNITVRNGSTVLSGTQKRDYLYSGDIRPNPVIMPVPFSQYSQARTRWISTGASVRREASSGARAVSPGTHGPEYFFSGLNKSGKAAGYIRTNPSSGIYRPAKVQLAGKVETVVIKSLRDNGEKFRGQSAHVLEIGSDLLPTDGSLSNYQLRLYDSVGTELRDFRILGHDTDTLWLAASSGSAPANAAKFSILDKFFEVITNGNEGLGATYIHGPVGNQQRFPTANIQVGFAFHKDPANPDFFTQNGQRFDRKRFPQNLNEFVFDLESKGLTSNREKLRQLSYPFAKIMVRFNTDYNEADPTISRAGVGPNNSKPGLRFVLLPYRY
ncbi:MAG: hypothetical protein CSA62_03525 [Planctomycetota bacterium]|nr:MAG: hypothetical protein CSA62_03525 [Planctomycetota bacterium]